MARPKGTKNRRTLLQNAVTSLGTFSTQMSKIIAEWLSDPDPEKQRDAVKTLAPYVWPRLQATQLTGEGGGALTVIISKEDANL